MTFWEKLQKIDRKIIYLILAVGIILPFFFPMGMKIPITKEVNDIYELIEGLGPDDCVMLSADYSPSVSAELSPMLDAIVRHCFKRKVKVLVMSLLPMGPGLAQPVLNKAAEDYGMIYGTDYVLLGYKVGYSLIILRMGDSITQTHGVDYYGTALRDIPMMENIINYDDIDLLVPLTGANYAAWIVYANEQFQQDIAPGMTAVMAADAYPYLQSGQIVGLLGGLKAAAEYETLNGEKYGIPPMMATIGMEAQNWAHVIILIFILVGNIAFYATRKKKG